jgi:large subunit ribosomal protein L31e
MGKDTKTKKEKKTMDAVSRDYTINLHKIIHKIGFKHRAPRAVKKIAEFASKNMLTKVPFFPIFFVREYSTEPVY